MALLLGLALPHFALDPPNLAALVWMSMVAIGLLVPLWFTSARTTGITVAAIHTNLAPFYVMLIALAFGGSVSGRQVLGAVLVAAGALLAQLASVEARGGASAGRAHNLLIRYILWRSVHTVAGANMLLARYRFLIRDWRDPPRPEAGIRRRTLESARPRAGV